MALFKPADSLLIATTAAEVEQQEGSACGDVRHGEFQVVRASGFATLARIHIFDRLSAAVLETLTTDEIWTAIGEWVIVACGAHIGNDSYIVTSDPYGYRPVFYSLVPGRGIIVADSFRGVIKGLSGEGVSPQIDVDTYITALGGTGPQFVYSTTNRTMAQGVHILPVGKALLVHPGEVHMVDRSHVFPIAEDTDDFDSLIAKGTELALGSIRAITRDSEAEHILHLSGGVDSRLILAHLLAEGSADAFTIRTLDPRRHPNGATRNVLEKDMEISDLIASDLGLEWSKAAPRQGISVDFMESLHSFQSHSSNYHYNFAPTSVLSGSVTPAVTLRGGGGELLRSTSGGRTLADAFRREHGNPDRCDQAFQNRWLSARLTPQLARDGAVRERAVAVIQESLQETTGEAFEPRMNDFYMRYRNRAHFGQGGRFAAGGEFSFQILSNTYYERAMKSLSFTDRSAGIGVKHLFEALAPELLSYPFENPKWAELFGGHNQSQSPAKRDWEKRFDAQSGNAPDIIFLERNEPGSRGERWRFSRDDALSSFVTSAAHLLEEAVDPSARPLLRSVHSMALPVLRRHRKHLHRAAAVMASAVDALRPVGFGGIASHLGDCPKDRANTAPRMEWSVGDLAPPKDGWSDRTPIEHRPSLERAGERLLLAAANPLTGIGDQAQFAFYLKRDGAVVDRRWYDRSQHAVFDFGSTTGTYTVQSFIRPNGLDGPTLRMDSAPVVI